MKQVTVATKSNEIIAHVFIENNEVKAIIEDGFKIIVDEVELVKENTTTENSDVIVETCPKKISRYVLSGLNRNLL